MKHYFLVMVIFLSIMSYLPTTSAQDDDIPRPPITSQNAGQMVEMAHTYLASNENWLHYANPPKITIHNTHLATAFEDQALIYNLPELTLQHDLGSGCGVEFSPDGKFLLYGGCGSHLTVWNIETQSSLTEIEKLAETWAFSSSGERLFVYTTERIHVYDAQTFTEIGDLPNLYTDINELGTMAPSGEWIAQIDQQTETIYWWDMEAEAPVETNLNGYIITIPFPRHELSDEILVTKIDPGDGNFSEVFRLWDAVTHTEIATLFPPEGYRWTQTRSSFPIIRFFDDGRRFAVVADRIEYDEELDTQQYSYIIQVWDTDDLAEPVFTLVEPDAPASPEKLEISSDDKWLLLYHYGTYISLTFWNLNTQTKLDTTLGGGYDLMFPTLSPENSLLAFSVQKTEDPYDFHHTVGLWNINTDSLLHMIWHDARVSHIMFTPDASLMLTITEDGIGHVWGVEDRNNQSSALTPPDNRVDYEGVSIDLGPFPESTISGEIIDPVGRWGPVDGFWNIAPGHISIAFDQPDHFSCWIEVFSAADYAAMYPDILEEFAEGLAAEPPEYRSDVDLWPINAVRNLFSKLQYIPLSNGHGWRSLAHYSQGAWPITGGVLYQVLGLINNGDYYLRAKCGTGVWFLPATNYEAETALGLFSGDHEHPGWEAFYNTFNDYLTDINHQLENSANSGFQPTLDELDALMASIQITDAPLGGNLPECNFDTRVGHSADQVQVVGQNRRFYCDASFDEHCQIEGEIPEGAVLDLKSGPVCSEDTLWWQVAYSDEKAIGWLPEAIDDDPWLAPLEQAQ